MATLYMTREGSVLRKTDERLRVTLEKETLLDVPLVRVEGVVALHRVTVTPQAIQSLLQHDIPMAFLSEQGRYLGRLEPAFSKNSLLRRAQYLAAFCPEQSLELACSFVAGKLANQRATLVRANRERQDETLSQAIAQIKKLEQRLDKAETLDVLRGLEGAGAAEYFAVFSLLLKTEAFSFLKRVRRPPTDPVNALLSFGYALLANDINGLLAGIGFDPYTGYLHGERYGRAALALDLMEEFRAVIVDSVALTCINKQILSPADFVQEPGGAIRLTEEARRTFLQQYEKRKRTEVRHPYFEYQVSYLRCMELQGRLLAKVLLGELERYPPFHIR